MKYVDHKMFMMNLERAATIAAQSALRKLHITWKNKSTIVARIKAGFQSLVTGMVEKITKMGADVRLNTRVREIDRQDGCVTVQIQEADKTAEALTFDLLIIAFPQTVQSLSPIMKLTAAEQDVFGSVLYNSYHTAAFSEQEETKTKEGNEEKRPRVLAAGGYCLVTQDHKPVDMSTLMNGQPMLALALDESPLTVFYSLHTDPKFSGQQFDDATIEMINKKFGYQYAEKPVVSHTWQYFPRFPAEHFVEKHNKLYNLQGHWATYYTGALCSFEVVERVVQYSRFLVDKFF